MVIDLITRDIRSLNCNVPSRDIRSLNCNIPSRDIRCLTLQCSLQSSKATDPAGVGYGILLCWFKK